MNDADRYIDAKTFPYVERDRGRISHFYVYAIMFDQDTFGIFSTREEAEEDLERQIAEGGPAWQDCTVERWRVRGEPEKEAYE